MKTKKPYSRLRRAPISEALVDIRAQVEAGFAPSTFEKFFRDEVGNEYSEVKPQRIFDRILQTKDGDVPFGIVGYVFRNPNENRVFQARTSGFSFSQLPKYEDWEKLIEETKRLWNLYCKVARVTRVSRIALRYINNFDVPVQLNNLREYLTAPPSTPSGIATLENGFYRSRWEFRDSDSNAKVILTSNFLEGERNTKVTLDIAVLKEMESPSLVDFWPEFERLRELKNCLFFNSISDRTKEMFE